MKINVSGSTAEQGGVQHKAPIQERALAAQYYSAEQPGTDLESESEPVEIQY